MSKFHRIATAAVFTVVFASIAPSALALPPVGTDPEPPCPRGYVREDGVCVKLPPPPPSIGPVVDTRRAAPDRRSERGPRLRSGHRRRSARAALTVQIRVDGALVKTLTANQPDPPVATPNAFATVPPPTLPGHSYNVTVPAAGTAQNICVTAVNVGSGSNTTVCKAVDRVVEFAGSSISYDLDHLQITDATLDSLDRVTDTNSTNIQQSTTISGEKTTTDTQGWSNTYGMKVTMSGGVKIPFISDFKVTVEGSASWVQNGSTSTTRKFAWSQPVLVPAHSKVVATVAVTKTTLSVPYTLSGDYVYRSGARVAGTNGGTFTGVNSHDLEVDADAVQPRRHARGQARPAAAGAASRGALTPYLGGVLRRFVVVSALLFAACGGGTASDDDIGAAIDRQLVENRQSLPNDHASETPVARRSLAEFVDDYQDAGFFRGEDPAAAARRIAREHQREWGEAPPLATRLDELTLLRPRQAARVVRGPRARCHRRQRRVRRGVRRVVADLARRLPAARGQRTLGGGGRARSRSRSGSTAGSARSRPPARATSSTSAS